MFFFFFNEVIFDISAVTCKWCMCIICVLLFCSSSLPFLKNVFSPHFNDCYLCLAFCHIVCSVCWSILSEMCVSFSVPFRETPSYTNRRRVTVGGATLTSSRSLLRSASDNNLNGAETSTTHSPVPSLRSLPPLAPPGGEAAADGSLQSTGSSRSSHSRSPSLHRVSEEPDPHILRRHPTYTHGRGRLRWALHGG